MKNLKTLNMFLNKTLKKPLFLLVTFICLTILVNAQGGGTDPGGIEPGDEPAPIDGGLSLLVAAGAAYGVKKYRDGRKQADGDKLES